MSPHIKTQRSEVCVFPSQRSGLEVDSPPTLTKQKTSHRCALHFRIVVHSRYCQVYQHIHHRMGVGEIPKTKVGWWLQRTLAWLPLCYWYVAKEDFAGTDGQEEAKLKVNLGEAVRRCGHWQTWAEEKVTA